MTTPYTYRYSRVRTETATAYCPVGPHRWTPALPEHPALALCSEHNRELKALWMPILSYCFVHHIDTRSISNATLQRVQDVLLDGPERQGYL